MTKYRKVNDNLDELEEKSLEDILSSIPLGAFHYKLLIVCGLAFMADAMEVTLLTFVSTCAGVEWSLSSNQVATISSVVFAGIFFGNISFGYIADKFGRKLAYASGSALVIIAGLLTSLSPNFLSLLIFRGIVGFGIGGSTIAFDILAEFLPTDQRGSFLIYIEFFWTFGSIFVATVAWLVLSSYGWRAMVFICSIPAGMSLLVSIIFVPESPRWLLSQERTEECKSILKMIATTNSCEGGIPPSYILRSTASECGDDVTSKGGGSASKSWYDFMMPNVKVFFALEIVWFSFGFGYYGLILFLSKIYENFSNSGTTTEPEQETCHFQYADMFVSAVFELVGLIIGIFLISRYGRVSLQCFGFAACGVCVVAMAVTPHHSTLNLLIGLCARMSMMISSCVAWVQTPELFKTEHRARGHTMAVAASRVGSFIVPYFINSATNELTSALILGGVLLLAASSVLFLPETKGEALDDRKDDPKGGLQQEEEQTRVRGAGVLQTCVIVCDMKCSLSQLSYLAYYANMQLLQHCPLHLNQNEKYNDDVSFGL